MALDPTQAYESLFGDFDQVSVPERIVARNIGIEHHYISFPLFSLPKKKKNETTFSHPFVYDSLPDRQTIVNPQERGSVTGFSFKNATLTYVDPIFVSTFGQTIKPVLSLNDQTIKYKNMKEALSLYNELVKFYEERIKDEKDVNHSLYVKEKNNLMKKINKYNQKINFLTDANNNVHYNRLISIPLLTNRMRIGLNKIPLFNVKYFIIETETGTTEPSKKIYMTQELFVGSVVGSPFFERQFDHFINGGNDSLQSYSTVHAFQTEEGGMNVVHPVWKRTRLYKYKRDIPSLNLTGTFVLDNPFVPVYLNENENDLYDFEIYLAYSTEQSGLVWRNPTSQKLVPITILVATSLVEERIHDLNTLGTALAQKEFLNPDPNWSDTFLVGFLSLKDLIAETVQREDFQSLEFETIKEDLNDGQKYLKTATSLSRLGIKTVSNNPSPLALLFNSIPAKMESKYDFYRDKIENENMGRGFSLESIKIKKIYSYETIAMAYEELITNSFVSMIKPRKQVLETMSLIGGYNSYNIEAQLVAKLETERKNIKCFTDENTIFGTKNLNVDKLFVKGHMYFLLMKNKAALILVQHVTPVGIVLQSADQVQILSITDYDRGRAFEIAKNDQMTSFLGEGAILIDPHFKWNGEFAFISKKTFNSAKQSLEKKNEPLTQENLLVEIGNVRKTSLDKYKFVVVQEIYEAKFYVDEPSELGQMSGGLRSKVAQAFRNFGK